MAHELTEEAQETIEEATHSPETIPEASSQPLPDPPAGEAGMAYRLGQLESRMEAMQAQLRQSQQVIHEQQETLQATEAQVEMQEELLVEAAEAAEEEGHDLPPLWVRLIGGHHRNR